MLVYDHAPLSQKKQMTTPVSDKNRKTQCEHGSGKSLRVGRWMVDICGKCGEVWAKFPVLGIAAQDSCVRARSDRQDLA